MKPATVTTTTSHDGVAVVTLTGELDLHVVREINDALTSALDGHTGLVCDTSGVTFVDSSILGTFVMVARSATAGGGCFRLVGATPSLRKLLRLTGLDEILPVDADLAAALAACGRRTGVPA